MLTVVTSLCVRDRLVLLSEVSLSDPHRYDVSSLPFQPGDFSVSMKARDKNKHFWVRVQSDGTYGIGTRRFGNLEELIAHYKNSPIYSNDKGEKLFLKAALPVN